MVLVMILSVLTFHEKAHCYGDLVPKFFKSCLNCFPFQF